MGMLPGAFWFVSDALSLPMEHPNFVVELKIWVARRIRIGLRAPWRMVRTVTVFFVSSVK